MTNLKRATHTRLAAASAERLTSPATKPATARGRARITKILEVARDLFVQGGYGEMTMRQVADRVGISLSNVQHYFPTRDDLLRAMLQRVTDSYDPAYVDVEAKIANPRERFAAVLRHLLADVKKAETEKLFVEIWSLATRDSMVREIFDMMYTHYRGRVTALVAAVNPKLSPAQAARRAALVAMQIEGLMLLISEAKPDHPELKGIEDECVQAMLNLVDAP